jgi:hypothetical protein
MKVGDSFYDNIAKCEVVVLYVFNDGDLVCSYKGARGKFIITSEIYNKAKQTGQLTNL